MKINEDGILAGYESLKHIMFENYEKNITKTYTVDQLVRGIVTAYLQSSNNIASSEAATNKKVGLIMEDTAITNSVKKTAKIGDVWMIRYYLASESTDDGCLYPRLHKVEVWLVTDKNGCFDFTAYDFNGCNITVAEIQKMLNINWIAENAEKIYG